MIDNETKKPLTKSGNLWMNASKKEIEEMTYEEAKEIMQFNIDMGKDIGKSGYIGPRAHTIQAYKIILAEAEKGHKR